MYYLLPFRFERLKKNEILVNEAGDYLVVPQNTVERIVNRKIAPTEEIYKDLVSSFFISETPLPDLIDNYATRLRTKKAFLNQFTTLHIFVLTLRCNQNCIYCQASSKECDSNMFDMKVEDLLYAIDLMFQTPSLSITMEFQGGEPSLVPHLLKLAIETAEQKNKVFQKEITYVLCSNSIHLTEEVLSVCHQYKVLISTSLDGPEFLHNRNRGKINSYSQVIAGINQARKYLGDDRISALMTTSDYSLQYPHEIVDSYIENGFNSIFLRPLNPYGLAKDNNWNLYYQHFVEFYKTALDYIIEINKSGNIFVEEFTAIILRKILTPFCCGFVDLQSPAGIINNVIVYNYDGYIYASDESRMLAEYNDYTFRLGHVRDKYTDIFYGEKAQQLAQIWATEVIAGCSDCAFQTYCGADPVRNYSMQGDTYGYRSTSLLCKKHKVIIKHIFSLLSEREKEVMPIFKTWIKDCH
ncbi:His-Xaa-Ser system radical SAM maturase HxsB [Odoribacter laneus]|uniref:His-Xaa-Ser system radical SAM maturase HxsB n=1 Tax=Odoribacter laneus TaxID=626933 RepID=UPI0023F2B54E|nr:His-Xaa-Ser system radical SAM maturase HxsB [Odoribacter laneus]